MYFPFVFGRQSELLALRETTKKYTASGRVIPVIEPVVKKPNDLLRCLKQFGDSEARAITIINPDKGDFKEGGAKAWRAEVDSILAKYPGLLPALKCGPKVTLPVIENFLAEYGLRQVALLYWNSPLTDGEIKKLAAKKSIAFHISLQAKMTSAQRSLLPKEKAVDIIDHFNKLARNADYAGAEPFTDRHKTYVQTSVGFGDYTVIGSLFQLGGGKPGAVAIHATFKHPTNKNIWVEHFVSDDTDINTGSAASKYLETVAKIASTTPRRVPEFGTNAALAAYIDDHNIGHFSGLGKSKERQIHHHIALMHDILHGAV